MASAVIGALRVNLGIDTAAFTKGLEGATKHLSKVGKNLQSVGRNLSGYISAPITALGAVTLKTAGDFEASMNRIGAASDATAQQLDAMRVMALAIGADTSKSASEAADAMEMLAKNGVSVADILGGAAKASVMLSEATGGQLSDAADVATNVMAQFKVEAKDLGKVVDGITGVTLQSQFGFEDYALAIGQAGGVAGSLGVTLEDFNAGLAATSSVFTSGSDAGTSFKNFLVRLVPASKSAAMAMQQLGLEFFNADGSMKSLSAISEELRTKMAGLSDEAMNEAMKDIFGVDAMRTAIQLMNQGGAGIDAMRAKIADASAEEQATARMKGFNGELEKLKGALEGLALAVAASGLLEFMTNFVARAAEIITALSQTNPELLKWGTVVAGLAAVIGPTVLAIGLMVSAFAFVLPVVVPLGAALAGLTLGLIAISGPVNDAAKALNQFLYSVGDDAKAKIIGFGQAFIQLKDVAIAAVSEMVSSISGWITGKLNAVWDSLTSKLNWVAEKFKALGDSVVHHSYIPDMVVGVEGWMDRLGKSMPAKAGKAADDTAKAMERLKTETLEGLKQEGQSVFAATRTDAEAAAIEIDRLNLLFETGSINFDTYQRALADVNEGLTQVGGMAQEVGSLLNGAFMNAFDSIMEGGFSLKETLGNLLKDIGRMFMQNAANMLFGGGGTQGGGLFGGIIGSFFGGGGGMAAAMPTGGFAPAMPMGTIGGGWGGGMGGELVIRTEPSPLFNVAVERRVQSGLLRAPSIMADKQARGLR